MRKTLIAGNWKMNGRRAMAVELCSDIVKGLRELEGIDVAICPPFTLLDTVHEAIAGSACMLGAQDMDLHGDGAYTGQVSAGMLKDCGCELVILGHSERRTLYGETDRSVTDKTEVALKNGMRPIVCVGETREEREGGRAENVVAGQLRSVIDGVGIESFVDAIIAYEPVWAIGTGLTAMPEQAQAMHAFIRNLLAERDRETARICRLLYGGSMKADNAAGLLGCPDIDGGLIGGASLAAEDFLGICKAA